MVVIQEKNDHLKQTSYRKKKNHFDTFFEYVAVPFRDFIITSLVFRVVYDSKTLIHHCTYTHLQDHRV